jgi:hypothetical protein
MVRVQARETFVRRIHERKNERTRRRMKHDDRDVIYAKGKKTQEKKIPGLYR